MPSNTNTTTTTKSVTPFNPTTHISNTNKATQRAGKPSASLKVNADTTQAPAANASVSSSPSDEENVRPASDKAQPPLSPAPLSLAGIPKALERDMRAYEHERQRTKRAGERAINRARKAGFGLGIDKRAQSGSREERDMKRKPRSKAEVEVDVSVDAVGRSTSSTSSVPAGALIEGLSAAASPRARAGAIARANAMAVSAVDGASVQVNLSDLVVLSQRKLRKVKEEDFELVPTLRSVIALDDMPTQVVHDMEIDEPWEHIESESDVEGEGGGEGKGRRKGKAGTGLSYAAIVVGNE
ncbi:hypothetical protein BDZ97DRAFT_1756646 [Flammula alnicola]|nr:hypothetical protein BDZ97DRAFT_1756646 [Flammula alnicola]